MVKDHIGNQFGTIEEMLEHWNVRPCTYYARKRSGWELKDILETPSQKKEVVDHLGKKYPSMIDMCKAYGMSYDTVRWRLSHGWSMQASLTTPVADERACEGNCIKDPSGRRFTSKNALCAFYGVSRTLVNYRMNNGLTLRDALFVTR